MFKAIAAECEPKNNLASRMRDKDCPEKEIIYLSPKRGNAPGKFGVT